ncbi:DUF5667 domain-containing protein [Bacillus sp. V33-4]|uniref:DUF5667 domain-containing protein n=1 Tax=Bacillus sp. V33-4 TaxID=2054169 RepID=UPI000C760211|nr:DUF5667 domain-containing protein [Bacillus sp. V33-4]PLR84349.1 hypothetical protein CVD23_12000 [Bacillus sp. V33-4]
MNRNIKRLISGGVFMGGLLFSTAAYAEGDTAPADDTVNAPFSQVAAGTTPDNSFTYFFDKLSEDLQLFFAFNDVKETELLLQFSQERLSELAEIAETDQDQYITNLIDEYLVSLQEAGDKVAQIVLDSDLNGEVKDQLTSELEQTAALDIPGEDLLADNKLEELNSTKKEAFIVASVVKELNTEKVKALRAEGLGFGQIVKVLALSEESEKTEAEIVDLLKNKNMGFGQIAKELNIDLGKLVGKVINQKEDLIEEAIEQAKKSNDTATVERLEKSLKDIKKQKVEFEIVKEYAEIEQEASEKLAKIQEKLATGEITKAEADKKIKKIQEKVAKELKELQEDADEELAEQNEEGNSNDREEEDNEGQYDDDEEQNDSNNIAENTENNKKQAEQTASKQKELEKGKKEQEQAAREAAEQERERQEELAEQQREKEEQARKQQAEQEKKQREQAEQTRKQQEKLAKQQVEQARKQQEQLAKEQAEKQYKDQQNQNKNENGEEGEHSEDGEN